MKRRLLTLAAVASLVVCLATVALWVVSYWRGDDLGVVTASEGSGFRRERHWSVSIDKGGVLWSITTWRWDSPAALAAPDSPRCGNGTIWWNALGAREPYRFGNWFAGFNIRRDGHTPVKPGRAFGSIQVRTPLWAVLAFVGAPLMWAVHTRHGRRKPGHCAQCGYDLRATPQRCPECGIAAGRE